MIKILFICHGNICRSQMAECMMKHMVRKAHLENEIMIDSAATSREEIGNGIYPAAARELQRHGVPSGNHRARQVTKADYETFDYLIGMEDVNIRNMHRLLGGDPQGKMSKMLDFAEGSQKGCDIDDPWYTGRFGQVYEQIEEGCKGLLSRLMGRRA